VDAIERERTEKMPHLKAVYFLRPTAENVRLLQKEFKEPKYGEYHVFFSNLTRDGHIQALAESDEHEVVQQVQEYYADFLAIHQEIFTLNVPSVVGLGGDVWDQAVFDRIHQGVCAMLLALKRRPQVRFQHNSERAMRIAESVVVSMDTEGELFSFRRADAPPLLLVLDRVDDPVTPLLNQWTYQAMVHELIGISNNRVDLRGRPAIPKELEQIVLSAEQACSLAPHTAPAVLDRFSRLPSVLPIIACRHSSRHQDSFYAKNLFLNYGDLAENVKALLDAFQAKTNSSKSISSIADMQAFVESYPEFRKLSGDVSKHVTLLGEINRLVDQGALMEVHPTPAPTFCCSAAPPARTRFRPHFPPCWTSPPHLRR
jgi:vacuolar protein sorting-associated protein 45